jgi:hypothetical protein
MSNYQSIKKISVRIEVLTKAVFWVVALRNLVEVYQTTRRYNPKDSHLQEGLCSMKLFSRGMY